MGDLTPKDVSGRTPSTPRMLRLTFPRQEGSRQGFWRSYDVARSHRSSEKWPREAILNTVRSPSCSRVNTIQKRRKYALSDSGLP